MEGINKSHLLVQLMYGTYDGTCRYAGKENIQLCLSIFPTICPLFMCKTVVGLDKSDSRVKCRGLFVGDDYEVFDKAARLSLKVNFEMLDSPLKVVVYLDPTEFKSTWLGNKAVYRTRMAIDDGGELIIIAPALVEFGEDKEIDRSDP